MNKLEQMARAHWNTANEVMAWDFLGDTLKQSQIARMGAALAVLREPSDAMLRAVATTQPEWEKARDDWQTMIDKADD